MTIVEQRPTTHPHFSMWAWICDALTPVVFVLLTTIGLFNEGDGGGGLLAKTVVIGIGLIAPIAGLILGIEAYRKAERSGIAAAVVAGVLIVAMPLALFLLVI
jgi:hypothetical protein